MKRQAVMALSIRQGERFFAPTAQRVIWNDRLPSNDVFSQQKAGGREKFYGPGSRQVRPSMRLARN